MADKVYSKVNLEFIAKIMAVLESFRHKGRDYLSYLQSRERDDEFLMRDSICKPLFVALGYHLQQDFSPEEGVVSGIIDNTIRNGYNHPIIVIETQSSRLKDLDKHRKRLFTYTEEIGARFAVLTDGVRFEAWECPGRGKARLRRLFLNFHEIYSKFQKKGIKGLSQPDIEQLLKLRFLKKELLFVREEELYEEPELDVSDSTIFSQLLEDLQQAMELVKSDIGSQFAIRQEEWKEYQGLTIKGKSQKIYPSQLKKYKAAQKMVESYEAWQNVSPGANNENAELFCAETMYILFNRLLLTRICEDKGITPRQISNGGIKTWLSWKGFVEFKKANYEELLRSAYETMNRVYPHLFRPDIFDWYHPDSEIILRVLFIFNRYNFKNVDRDILGKLYERYIDREERKRLGQFYTPEEVIDYILEAAGYTADDELEGKLLLDPACGSGGFLVRAVKTLVEKYQRRNIPADVILNRVQECIYGFDINPFAAHLAEMNLLFQVIDLIAEAKQTNPEFNMEKFNVFVTDTLKLPKTEEVQRDQLSLMKEETSEYLEDAEIVRQIKLKRERFRKGFDFVVGNPPYGYRKIFTPSQKRYLKTAYNEVYQGTYDFYQFFIKRGIDFLNAGGRLGYIVSNTFLSKPTSTKLRLFLLNTNKINELFDLGQSVFDEPVIENVLLIVTKESNANYRMENEVDTRIGSLDKEKHKFAVKRKKTYLQEQFLKNPDHIFVVAGTDLLTKVKEQGIPLGEIVDMSVGINTGNVGVREVLMSRKQKSETFYRLLKGRDIGRYSIEWEGDWICYDPDLVKTFGKKGRTLPPRKFFERSKILVQRTRRGMKRKLNACFDEDRYYCLNRLTSIVTKDRRYALKYILGLINSQLLDYYFQGMFREYEVKPVFLKQLPIKQANSDEQNEIIGLVDQMLEINKRLPKLEELAKDIRAFLKVYDIATKDIADCSEATPIMGEILGNPKIRRQGNRVFIDRRSYIECTKDNLCTYLELYLNSIKGELRGKTKSEFYRLVKLPENIEEVLDGHKALVAEVENLKNTRYRVNKLIDQKVYSLYGLTDEEISIIEGN